MTQYFPPEFGAAAARNSEHAALWAAAGHSVEVCTGMPNYPSGVVQEGYRRRWFMREETDGYRVFRSWIYATPNRAVWKRALASLSFACSALFTGAFRCQRPDVVIASSGPFFVGPLGYALSVIKRAPLVMEVRDILPQQAVDTGMLKNPALIKSLTAIEEFLYRKAALVITVAEASRRALIERGVPETKCHTVENGIREDFFKPGPRDNDVRAEHGWGGKFIAMYLGAHGVSQGLMTLLEAAERLRERQDIRFVFAGDGAAKPELVAYAKARGLTNVEFLPLQPKEKMPAYYCAADVCLAPLKKGPYFTLNIPSKLFEIMACGRPVLLGAEGQARKLIEEAGAGLALPPEDADALAGAIVRLEGDRGLANELGEKGRAFVVQQFTRRAKAQKYIELLEQLQSHAPRPMRMQ